MTLVRSIYQRFQRYRTLHTHEIHSLPIAILMPHSACNCKCVMCDIWKANGHRRQLNEEDVKEILESLHKLGTKQVLFSGGEALLHPLFFRFCELLQRHKIKISLLSTGLTIKQHASSLASHVNEIIVSLDGDPVTHDKMRNIPGAFKKLEEGVLAIKEIDPSFRITARSVIHRLNFRVMPEIIETARRIGLEQVSFFPADVSSQAFNRAQPWEPDRQQELLLTETELEELKRILDRLFKENMEDFITHFIAESPLRLEQIHQYYAAFYGKQPFPYRKCNAPWVSTVIEADGTIRHCFFHEAIGNINEGPLENILNNEKAISFRKELDIANNEICKKCVCSLYLSPGSKID